MIRQALNSSHPGHSGRNEVRSALTDGGRVTIAVDFPSGLLQPA